MLYIGQCDIEVNILVIATSLQRRDDGIVRTCYTDQYDTEVGNWSLTSRQQPRITSG